MVRGINIEIVTDRHRCRSSMPTKLALAAMLYGVGTAPNAYADQHAAANTFELSAATFSVESNERERRERRADRLSALGVYGVVAAAVVGGSYLLRNDFMGRSIATTAAGWGGLALGAAIATGFSGMSGCEGRDCGDDDAAGTIVGGLLGGAAGSIAGYLLTSRVGMSRVYTTAAGMAPFVVIVGAATVAQW